MYTFNKKLLATSGNTKIEKSEKNTKGALFASLSMMPTRELCPSSKAAGCFEACLQSAGRGAFDNVRDGRQSRTDYWNNARDQFLAQLRKELAAFARKCAKENKQGIVRLNVLSDIQWEDYGIPQEFPTLSFYDYTKRAKRLGNTPKNYTLIFSYSGVSTYAKQVAIAETTSAPMAVVFRGALPTHYKGRPVIDGDQNDWLNANSGRVIVGLKAKGKAKKDTSGFVVDTVDNILAMG